jgi:hypothetical protein
VAAALEKKTEKAEEVLRGGNDSHRWQPESAHSE